MLDSPFFGRVDFVYEGEDEPETFYIGIGNLCEKAGHAVRWSMTGEHRSADFFMIMTEDLLLMKHLPELLKERSLPSGSTRSVREIWSTNLKVM